MFCATALLADTAETVFFRGVMLPTNEVPAVPIEGSSSALLSGQRRNLITALRAVLRMPRFNMIKQMSESKAVIGLNMLTLWKDRQTLEPWSEPLLPLLADGTVKPVVAGTFSFEDAGAAQTMITERRNLGKVVLVP